MQPTNRKLEGMELQQASGFDRMPSYLANLVAHCREYEVILTKWRRKDFRHMLPMLTYPDRVNTFVEAEYKRLLQRKFQILEAIEDEHEHGLMDGDGDEKGGDGDEEQALHFLSDTRSKGPSSAATTTTSRTYAPLPRDAARWEATIDRAFEHFGSSRGFFRSSA